VKPESAFSFKQGKTKSISEALVTNIIFLDAKKGLRASEKALQKSFGNVDPLKIAEVILSKGTFQMTTQQRKQLVQEKRKKIISFISRQSVDPRTNLPHPPTRIEQAMSQIRYSIDTSKAIEEQAKEVIKLLRPFLPLKVENASVSVQIPSEYSRKVYGFVKGFGSIKREEWKNDGSWFAIVELPAGSYGSFLEKLGEKTRGTLKTKLLD
jgi:ribosome maturation protein SDO1